MRFLSNAPLVIGIETFRHLDHARVPTVPLARLIATNQDDNVPIRVEREQHSHAAIGPCLLQFAHARPVDDVHARPSKRRAAGDDPGDRAFDLGSAVGVQGS
jgi:hypothetical protein